MNNSLQRRLTSSLLISLIFAFSLIWLLIHFSIKYLAYDYIYTRLSHDSETLLALVIKNPQQFKQNLPIAGAVYQQPFSGHYFQITQNNNIIYSRSLWDQSLHYDPTLIQGISSKNTSNSLSSTELRITTIGPMQQPLLLLINQFSKNGQLITIAIAEDIKAIDTAISNFKAGFTLVVIIILIILIALQLWGLKKGLRPLTQLQQDLKLLELGEITAITTPVPNELKPVIQEINHLHSALASRLTRYRNALSDLAHALKKPLTVLQQLSQDEQLKSLPHISHILKNQSDNTRRLTERILNKARLAGAVSSVNRFNFIDDLTDLVAMLKMMYQGKNLQLDIKTSAEINDAFDREDMLELLGNLLDNACKWAKSQVIITIEQQPHQLEITIVDDGIGIDKQQIHAIGQRGIRLDETTEGHGLGLAIVSDIIEHYQASISYSHAEELGGLQVKIKIPPLSIKE